MEGEPFNPVQKQEDVALVASSPKAETPLHLSFIPPELLKKVEKIEQRGPRDRCALIGMILGVVAVVSWVVILFGVVYSIAGIVLSVIGLKSSKQKWAKIGLGLSIFGLILSLLYVYAVYTGMVNYNYFTSEFLGL